MPLTLLATSYASQPNSFAADNFQAFANFGCYNSWWYSRSLPVSILTTVLAWQWWHAAMQAAILVCGFTVCLHCLILLAMLLAVGLCDFGSGVSCDSTISHGLALIVSPGLMVGTLGSGLYRLAICAVNLWPVCHRVICSLSQAILASWWLTWCVLGWLFCAPFSVYIKS